MNLFIQNILVFIVFAIAIAFLIKKFVWKPKVVATNKKIPGNCGNNGCGCH
ncbi:hypothetical protein SAMN04487910_4096 [Aquimarina amphilecti]|uniref:Virus attachment protein p12 family protein n=1 Tax=Aquimarina amphilecti TaxID=1038014 RepID=A0A1H7VHP0_AQUAM|nr:hypothetical protein SAMN04487910_4096 [Aquimarina amphilecti]